MTQWAWQDLTALTAPDLATLRQVVNQQMKRLEQAIAPALAAVSGSWDVDAWDDGPWPIGGAVDTLIVHVADHEKRLDAGGL